MSLNLKNLIPKQLRIGSMLLLLLGMGKQPVFAQTPASFSIKDCIDFASQNNSNIKISKLDEEIGLQQIKEVKGRALPQISGSGSFQKNLKLPRLVLPSGFGGEGGGAITVGLPYNTGLTGEATQMLFDPSFNLGLKAAKQTTRLYQQNTQQVSEQTAYNIASAYYQVIVVEKQLQLLRSNLTNTRKTLATTELQFKNGVAKRVDVNRLQVNASNLESQIKQAELNQQQALNQLKNQMGMPLEQPLALTDTTLTFSNEEAIPVVTPAEVYSNRVEVGILQTNLELQRLDRKNIHSGYFPTLSAFGNYGYTGQGSDFAFFKTANNDWVAYTTSIVGVRLTIPVFDGFQRKARVQQSRIKARQLEENLMLTKQNINLELSNAQIQYQNTLQRINAEQQNVALAQEVYGITQLEFREGVGTSTDVVEAETSLRQAQNTYITTLLDLYTARLDLEKAKGNLLSYLNQ